MEPTSSKTIQKLRRKLLITLGLFVLIPILFWLFFFKANQFTLEVRLLGDRDVMVSAGLAASKGEARRLVQQGGVSVNDQKVTDPAATLSDADFADGAAIIKKGKKVYHKITLA